MIAAPRLAPLLGSLALLGACSGPIGDAPSLGPRPIEKIDVDTPVAEAPPADPAAADPGLKAKIAAALAAAEAGQARFAAEQAKATAAVDRARGQPVGSDAWVAAQTALSSLQAARDGVQDAAADIDTLRTTLTSPTDADLAAIETATDKVATMITANGEAVAALAGRLPE